jgi:hypothetical protein
VKKYYLNITYPGQYYSKGFKGKDMDRLICGAATRRNESGSGFCFSTDERDISFYGKYETIVGIYKKIKKLKDKKLIPRTTKLKIEEAP